MMQGEEEEEMHQEADISVESAEPPDMVFQRHQKYISRIFYTVFALSVAACVATLAVILTNKHAASPRLVPNSPSPPLPQMPPTPSVALRNAASLA